MSAGYRPTDDSALTDADLTDEEREAERLVCEMEAREAIEPSPEGADAVQAGGPTWPEVAMSNAAEVCRLLVVVAKLGNALAKLTDACYAADAHEELAEEIDGSLLDEAEAAIALIDRFKPPRAGEAALQPGGGE